MKIIMKGLLAGLVTFLIFYLFGAFFSSTLNIQHWSKILRGLVTFFGGFFSLVITATTIDSLSEK